MTDMIVTDGLVKHYGPIKAVDGISLTVKQGEVLGFLGPNGAGKSTTMKMITGFLAPTAGTARICGFDILEKPLEAKRRIGYLPEGAPAYPDMTPLGFLKFIADLRGLSGARKRERLDYVVERIELGAVLHQPIETLSKGFKRRVGLAQAILHDPEVLIMDEPTDGLDPNQKHQVRELIQELSAEKCIVISTHILEEVHAVCSRAAIIARGKLMADGTPAELEARSRYHNAVSLRVDATAVPALREKLAAVSAVESVEIEDDRAVTGPAATSNIVLLPRKDASIVAEIKNLFADGGPLADQATPVHEIRVEAGRLDEVFRRITGAEQTIAKAAEEAPGEAGTTPAAAE